jgi:hypothetical protein
LGRTPTTQPCQPSTKQNSIDHYCSAQQLAQKKETVHRPTTAGWGQRWTDGGASWTPPSILPMRHHCAAHKCWQVTSQAPAHPPSLPSPASQPPGPSLSRSSCPPPPLAMASIAGSALSFARPVKVCSPRRQIRHLAPSVRTIRLAGVLAFVSVDVGARSRSDLRSAFQPY